MDKSLESLHSAVKTIKEAILRSQYRAISHVNKEQLSLYYGIGRYVSHHSRDGFWGTGAIGQISEVLQKELPGLRGFSATNIRKMRYFYDEWSPVLNRPPLAVNLQLPEYQDVLIQPPTAVDFDMETFIKISFSHHIEILNKKMISENSMMPDGKLLILQQNK